MGDGFISHFWPLFCGVLMNKQIPFLNMFPNYTPPEELTELLSQAVIATFGRTQNFFQKVLKGS